MANMRIVADNAAARATLSASSSAGAFVSANLQLDDKTSVWRAIGTSATLTLTWGASERVAAVALPFCNLSPSATIRVRGYADMAGNSQLFDTGNVLACPASAMTLHGWSATQAASAYAYGGGTYARIWFGEASVMRLTIDIVDPANLQGYIEAACLVVGRYWSPAYNVSSPEMTPGDTTELYRTDAGGQRAEAGYTYRRLSMGLTYMPAADRSALVKILRAGRVYPILVSLFPDSADFDLERDHMVYGRRSSDSKVALQAALSYGTSIEIEEI